MPDSPRRTLAVAPPPPRPRALAALGWTVAWWLGALGATVLLRPLLLRSVYLFFWVAILATAWRAGVRYALLAIAASVLAANYLFVEPVGRIMVSPADVLQIALFTGVAMLVSALLHRLEEAQRRTAEDASLQGQLNDQLQDQAMELEQQREEAEALATEAEMARDEAERANRAKAEFLATMSHELRTPINAALGYVDLMEAELQGPLTAAQRESLARIRRSQRRLLTLVNDVLSFTRLESARLELTPVDVAVSELIPDLEDSIRPLADGRKVRFQCGPADAGLVVHADRDRLEQVLLNLLANAVKFTPAGGEVVLSCEGAERDVRLVVRDTGRGIPPEQHERIFEPFVQVEQGLTRTAEGTGLGLAISRGLARAMGGDVTVESTPGVGSAFTVSVPRARLSGPSPSAPTTPSSSSARASA